MHPIDDEQCSSSKRPYIKPRITVLDAEELLNRLGPAEASDGGPGGEDALREIEHLKRFPVGR